MLELIPISYVCKAQGYVRIVAVEILLMLSGLINHLSTEVFYCWLAPWIASYIEMYLYSK